MKYKVTEGLIHDFPNHTRDNHTISLACYCSPRILSGKIYGITGYELFLFNGEEVVVVHE